MTFMNSLATNPGGSSIYGQPSDQVDYTGPLSIVNQLKDREMKDFKDKANFMSDLSLKQNRLQALFDPNSQSPSQNVYKQSQAGLQPGQGSQGMNVVAAQDPNEMTGYQKGELGVRQAQLGQESQKIAQTGKLGQEAQDTKSAQEKLNQQKSDQINATKQADLERKTEEANNKLQLAQEALAAKTKAGEDTIAAHKDLAAAMEERYKLEMAIKQHEFDITSEQHNQQIKAMQDKLDQAGHTNTTTTVNADGSQKTVDTKRGSTVKVTGKDGQTYEIPANKVDDWNANHAPSQ